MAPTDPAGKLRTLGILVLVHSCAETWFWYLDTAGAPPSLLLLALLNSGLLALGLQAQRQRLALGLLALLLVWQLWWTFPVFANHTFLRLIVAALLALPAPRGADVDRERTLALTAIGTLTVVVLFYTGLQKLFYGTYFEGQYLAFQIARAQRFTATLGWILPDGELDRLLALGPPLPALPGSGPYRVAGAGFTLVSNLVWLAEIGLAGALVWERTRRAAVWATLVLLLLIELGARELFFGMLFGNLVLALHPTDYLRRLLPWSIAVYGAAVSWKLVGAGGFLT